MGCFIVRQLAQCLHVGARLLAFVVLEGGGFGIEDQYLWQRYRVSCDFRAILKGVGAEGPIELWGHIQITIHNLGKGRNGGYARGRNYGS